MLKTGEHFGQVMSLRQIAAKTSLDSIRDLEFWPGFDFKTGLNI